MVVVDVGVGIVAVVETLGCSSGGRRGRGGWGCGRGRGEGGGTQALNPPALLANAHVATRLQEAARQQGRGCQGVGGGVGGPRAQRVVQKPLRPWTQIGTPTQTAARQGPTASVQFTVGETHVANEPDGAGGSEGQTGRVAQNSDPRAAQRSPAP